MNTNYFAEQFDRLAKDGNPGKLAGLRQKAFASFNAMGIPTAKHEEWKYTHIGRQFEKNLEFARNFHAVLINNKDVDLVRLPGHQQANELVFVNGHFSAGLSAIRSPELTVLPLEEAAASDSFAEIVSTHLGHSGQYLRDGINALSTAFLDGAAFVCLHNKARLNLPLYIYHLANSCQGGLFTQPRSLIYLTAGSSMQVVETFATQGEGESLLNHITEIVAEKDSRLEYYKIQNDGENASQVSTTHIRQLGTSYTHSVVVSLNGQLVRNNLNVIFDAPGCESHLFGLYCLHGQTHLDNHTVVDNGQPNCLSNELYKGIIDDEATGIFNGKIFVRKDAQKTNAYQSNKNILLSNHATINAKPQLEIFADDVKCSHGCTVGSLDEDALFYLRTRGVSRSSAKALLLGAFAGDILGNIHLEPLRHHVQQLIAQRLNIENL